MTWAWDQLHRIWTFMAQGGPVMLPLAATSVVMWTLIIKKAFYLQRMGVRNMPRAMAARMLKEGLRPDPRQYRGATAMLVTEFLRRRQFKPEVDRCVMDETVMAVGAGFDRHMAAIGVLAAAAPLLGLLGTVLGMIGAFDTISFYGTGNARAMAGGISEALISTQTGLLVAIPGLTMKNFLASRAQGLKHRVSSLGMYLQRHI